MGPIEERLKSKEPEIEEILDSWGLSGASNAPKRHGKKSDILKWLERFQPGEFDDAFLILSKIQYHNEFWIRERIESLSNALKNIFKNDLSSVKIFPLGKSPASSGAIFLYDVRKYLHLSESAFPYQFVREIDLTGVKAIIFFDDIIGSGNQAVRFAEKYLNEVTIAKHYCAVLGFTSGIEIVKKSGYFTDVFCGKELSDEYRAFSDNSHVFLEKETRKRVELMCRKYGEKLYPEHPLGYDNTQALIVFPHNVPNNPPHYLGKR